MSKILIFYYHHVKFGFRVILTERRARPQRAEEQDKELKTSSRRSHSYLLTTTATATVGVMAQLLKQVFDDSSNSVDVDMINTT